MAIYVIENLGRDLKLSPVYAGHMQMERNYHVEMLMKMYWKRKHVNQMELQAAAQKLLLGQMEKQDEALNEQSKVLASLFREFNQESPTGIILRLKDGEPINRWMAIQVTQRRWESLEMNLITLLEDPVPLVRQAAHQALVKLSRGNDFGPAGVNPNRDVVRAAQKQWRGWLELQDR